MVDFSAAMARRISMRCREGARERVRLVAIRKASRGDPAYLNALHTLMSKAYSHTCACRACSHAAHGAEWIVLAPVEVNLEVQPSARVADEPIAASRDLLTVSDSTQNLATTKKGFF
jgi:hypothetical protein